MIQEYLDHPRIIRDGTGNKLAIRYDMRGFGPDICAHYWQEPRPTDLDPREGWDGWRYCLPPETSPGWIVPLSAPSQQSCEIQILKNFIEAGLLAPSENNAHLDERNHAILDQVRAAWMARTGAPRVGDFVQMPNGSLRRCSHAWDDGMQTSDGGSYYAYRDGHVSMSGSLYPSLLWEFFKDTGEVKNGLFWFFSHGQAGAGRGVYVYLPCRVYRLAPFAMTEADARKHPSARRAAEFWGENDRGHLEAIARLTRPAVMYGRWH